MQTMILPPQCIGIVGGGQLARMLLIAAKQMGYKVAVLEPSIDAPATLMADFHIQGGYSDEQALQELAAVSDVITTEFENVPASSMSFLANLKPTYPSAYAISISQNRIKEKTFFNSIGLATAKFHCIASLSDCDFVANNFFPAILKTNTLGYDGKGQVRVKNNLELVAAYQKLNTECVLEKCVRLVQEVSVVIARNQNETKCFDVVENVHVDGILETSLIPANISNELAERAKTAAQLIADKLDYIGVMAVEFFVDDSNNLLVNEMAPRTHNSGHVTIEACYTSQFEQQVRAICGLKLASTKTHTQSVMLNLLGDSWLKKPNFIQNILANHDSVKLHLYEKTEAKLGRKMGHLTVSPLDKTILAQLINIK